MAENRTLVLIPARMAATRLPGKPLLDIGGVPMIVHVLRRAAGAQTSPGAVATPPPGPPPRRPDRPLWDSGGVRMTVLVLRRGEAAQIARVAVAPDPPKTPAAVTAHGGVAVMTRPDHPSGSDRIYEAMKALDPEG